MDEQSNILNPLSEYKQFEKNLRLELMNVCKKYIQRLSIVSIMGILDLVKQETLELEKVTKSDVDMDRHNQPPTY